MTNKRIVFVWDNIGPGHADRCEAVARHLGPLAEVHVLEIAGQSHIYEWVGGSSPRFKKRTLFPDRLVPDISVLARTSAILKACWSLRPAAYFFAHYEEPSTLICATLLRLSGSRVYVMNDSKFDDYSRTLWREIGKTLFYLPYHGALASGIRSRDYLRFLGFRRRPVATNFNALSLDRIRRLARAPVAPDGRAFGDRHFTIVARMVPKKNLHMALESYAKYRATAKLLRPLHVCGSGPLEESLRQLAIDLGLVDHVHFHGFVQSQEVACILANTLCLLLPSIEEQFGNVVIEAQALGVPVILSENCGARDCLVRSGVTGFVVEPDNPAGMAFFMGLVSDDEDLWRRMASSIDAVAHQGDAANFANAIASLALTTTASSAL